MYRGPNPKRHALQASALFRHAGHTATWNQWISSSAGVEAAGQGPTDYYRQQLITAHFGDGGNPRLYERQRAAGMLTVGDVFCVTREQVGTRDTIVWNGDSYRVESEPVKGALDTLWVSQLKRGQ